VAARHLLDVTEQNIGIFCLPGFVADRGQICFSRLPRFFHATHLSCHISFLDVSIRILQECHPTKTVLGAFQAFL
jgi:hypothetical protein